MKEITIFEVVKQVEKIEKALQQINEAAQREGYQPLSFSG